ncbi:carbamoyl-phosphate synthase, small subunit [Acidimicrobium ferrooxidans DSM 10331]|uniref:carbamoyl-phosphate synthase (glutamine-hydrolyzing) n=1 Tax=Acidimicrobium ferrooxidans (strain DSM 10331 / JCM 15462 / NBRC 103882 / ICP) TaxID=525909 RepID=C7M0V8_ACIFD|nr:glutamine-hydrolyzing carbamoyl-phosphate synthase small subunit [Acidimicrobium ferrooxidans]ACU54616.1 carbamoyl-phosphate synthase, small subunit [Acidimicrobium ferrooxidans DSM 10331]
MWVREESVQRIPAWLVLRSGARFRGAVVIPAGVEPLLDDVEAEVVFNTAMSGYVEAITDPSYYGQMVCFTTAHLGTYGVRRADVQSVRPWVSAVLAPRYSVVASNHAADTTLAAWLWEARVPLFVDFDSRRLVRLVRAAGAEPGIITTGDPDAAAERVRVAVGTEGRDLVRAVTRREPRELEPLGHARSSRPIVAIDFGVKERMLETLRGPWRLVVVPATIRLEELEKLDPLAVFLSNGPGDPAALTGPIELVRSLLGVVPIAGICLGHQLLALAAGAETIKLPFGHHGSNHPVRLEETGRVAITAQNHSYAVDEASLGRLDTPAEVTRRNLFDGVVEGLRLPALGAVSVQYHPEAAPGPLEQSSEIHDELLSLLGGGSHA